MRKNISFIIFPLAVIFFRNLNLNGLMFDYFERQHFQ